MGRSGYGWNSISTLLSAWKNFEFNSIRGLAPAVAKSAQIFTKGRPAKSHVLASPFWSDQIIRVNNRHRLPHKTMTWRLVPTWNDNLLISNETASYEYKVSLLLKPPTCWPAEVEKHPTRGSLISTSQPRWSSLFFWLAIEPGRKFLKMANKLCLVALILVVFGSCYGEDKKGIEISLILIFYCKRYHVILSFLTAILRRSHSSQPGFNFTKFGYKRF